MRVAALSDIHGNAHALQAVLDDLFTYGTPDVTVVAGDLAAQGPMPAESVDLLREHLPDALFIQGNTDRYLQELAAGRLAAPRRVSDPADVAERQASLRHCLDALGDERMAWLSSLPKESVRGPLWVFHGSPGDDEAGVWPDSDISALESDQRWQHLIISGHTHHPVVRWPSDGSHRVLVNDGSVGWTLDGDLRPSYALVDLEEGRPPKVEMRRVEYDRSLVVAELERREVPWRRVVIHFVTTGKWQKYMSAGEPPASQTTSGSTEPAQGE
jgi:predicted phosphodiesterase